MKVIHREVINTEDLRGVNEMPKTIKSLKKSLEMALGDEVTVKEVDDIDGNPAVSIEPSNHNVALSEKDGLILYWQGDKESTFMNLDKLVMNLASSLEELDGLKVDAEVKEKNSIRRNNMRYIDNRRGGVYDEPRRLRNRRFIRRGRIDTRSSNNSYYEREAPIDRGYIRERYPEERYDGVARNRLAPMRRMRNREGMRSRLHRMYSRNRQGLRSLNRLREREPMYNTGRYDRYGSRNHYDRHDRYDRYGSRNHYDRHPLSRRQLLRRY